MLPRDSHHPGLTESRPVGRGNSGWHNTFLTSQRHGGPPRMRDQLNVGATSESTRTWKMMHAIHAPIHSNKANMKGWLWRPNDIWGPCGPKASRHSFYRWEKTPKKPHPRKLSQPGIEPGPAAWQARMLLLAPQQWMQCHRICVTSVWEILLIHYTLVLWLPHNADRWH